MKKLFKLLVFCFFLTMFGYASADAISVTSYDFSGPYINCHVPQINGMVNKDSQQTVNQFLLAQIQVDLTGFQQGLVDNPQNSDPNSPWQGNLMFESKYTVKFQRSFMLSIIQDEYWFSGGAHGMALRKAANINTETGHIYKLNQLFIPGCDWLGRLNNMISQQIASRKDFEIFSFKTIENYDQFYFLDEGLVVYFQPYEIGPWVLGMSKFVIPWVDLRDILTENLQLY